jgi:hypothetical protein
MARSVRRIAVLTALAGLAGCGRSPNAPAHVRGESGRTAPMAESPQYPSAASALTTGRFQIVAGPRETSGTYLLDTMTGRVWRLVQKRDLEGEPYVWEHMDRLDSNADDYVFKQEHQQTGRQ